MFVDEYHDTSWTRGQYPAAPPYMSNLAKRLVFIWQIIAADECIDFKKTTTCE